MLEIMIQRYACVRACIRVHAHAYAIEGGRRTYFGRTVFHNWED